MAGAGHDLVQSELPDLLILDVIRGGKQWLANAADWQALRPPATDRESP